MMVICSSTLMPLTHNLLGNHKLVYAIMRHRNGFAKLATLEFSPGLLLIPDLKNCCGCALNTLLSVQEDC